MKKENSLVDALNKKVRAGDVRVNANTNTNTNVTTRAGNRCVLFCGRKCWLRKQKSHNGVVKNNELLLAIADENIRQIAAKNVYPEIAAKAAKAVQNNKPGTIPAKHMLEAMLTVTKTQAEQMALKDPRKSAKDAYAEAYPLAQRMLFGRPRNHLFFYGSHPKEVAAFMEENLWAWQHYPTRRALWDYFIYHAKTGLRHKQADTVVCMWQKIVWGGFGDEQLFEAIVTKGQRNTKWFKEAPPANAKLIYRLAESGMSAKDILWFVKNTGLDSGFAEQTQQMTTKQQFNLLDSPHVLQLSHVYQKLGYAHMVPDMMIGLWRWYGDSSSIFDVLDGMENNDVKNEILENFKQGRYGTCKEIVKIKKTTPNYHNVPNENLLTLLDGQALMQWSKTLSREELDDLATKVTATQYSKIVEHVRPNLYKRAVDNMLKTSGVLQYVRQKNWSYSSLLWSQVVTSMSREMAQRYPNKPAGWALLGGIDHRGNFEEALNCIAGALGDKPVH